MGKDTEKGTRVIPLLEDVLGVRLQAFMVTVSLSAGISQGAEEQGCSDLLAFFNTLLTFQCEHCTLKFSSLWNRICI